MVLEHGSQKLLGVALGICKINENTQINHMQQTQRSLYWMVLKEIFLFQEGDTRSYDLVLADEKVQTCEAGMWKTKRGQSR